jgi:hypothetical protein
MSVLGFAASVLGFAAQGFQVTTAGGIPVLVAGGIINGFGKKINGIHTYKEFIIITSVFQMIFNRYLGIQGLGWGLVGGSITLFGASVSHMTSANPNYKKMAPTMALVAITSFALTLLANRALGGQLLPIVAATEIGKATITKVLAVFMGLIIATPEKAEIPRNKKSISLIQCIAGCSLSMFVPFPNAAVIGLLFVNLNPFYEQQAPEGQQAPQA